MIRHCSAAITEGAAAQGAAIAMQRLVLLQAAAASAATAASLAAATAARRAAAAAAGSAAARACVATAAAAACCWELFYERFAARRGAAYDAVSLQPCMCEGFIQPLQCFWHDAAQLRPCEHHTTLGAPDHRKPCKRPCNQWANTDLGHCAHLQCTSWTPHFQVLPGAGGVPATCKTRWLLLAVVLPQLLLQLLRPTLLQTCAGQLLRQ